MSTDLELSMAAEIIPAICREGYVSFVRKPDPAGPVSLDKHGQPKTFEDLFSVPVDELQAMFPELAGWLTHDAYFGVNPSYRAAPYLNRLTGLPTAWRGEKRLQALATCYVDIDCGRPESDEPGARLTWTNALSRSLELSDEGAIPTPSIVARSGRGVYLFWLLRDAEDPSRPPRAYPERIPFYKAIHRALGERLRTHELPADRRSIDAAKVLRVPGSIHRKAQRRVRYLVLLDGQGRHFLYTLAEMAAFVDVPALDCGLPSSTRALALGESARRRTKHPGSCPARARGRRRLHALRAQDLLTIAAWRGGFLRRGMKYPDGSTSPGRRLLLSLFASLLKGADEDRHAALDAACSMAATMRPPWPDEPGDGTTEAIVMDAYAGKPGKQRRRRKLPWRNSTLCALLGVTAEVARELGLRTILPPDLAQEIREATPSQADVEEARRDFVRQYVETHGWRTLSARKLARLLHENGLLGTATNQETANQLLNSLGHCARPRGRPRRSL